METTRDLGRVELWQESLQRSLARRGKLARTSLELSRLQPQRDLAAPELFLDSTTYWRTRRAAAHRSGVPIPLVGLGGVSALALIAATTLPGLVGGGHASRQKLAFAARALERGGRASAADSKAPEPMATALRVSGPARHSVPKHASRVFAPASSSTVAAQVEHPAVHRSEPVVHHSAPASKRAVASVERRQPTKVPAKPHSAAPPPSHKPAPAPAKHATPPPPSKQPSHHSPTPSTNGYVNPLAHASVTPERIDQGVDYAGTGTLTALGAGRVNFIATTDSGWPGDFIEYQLLNGPYAGRYVYYAEGVSPVSGLSVGTTLRPGQAVATLIPGWSTGIEIGWGAGIGSETLAEEDGDWSQYDNTHSIPTPQGESFSALIASLGGPPGR